MRNIPKTPQADNYLAGMAQYESKMREAQETATTNNRKHRFEPDSAEVAPFNDNYEESAQKTSRKWLEGIKEQAQEKSQYYEGGELPKKNLNELGLCRFQYKDTIEGKMVTKSNHHIDLAKSHTHKINNKNKVWYDNGKDIPKVEKQAEEE